MKKYLKLLLFLAGLTACRGQRSNEADSTLNDGIIYFSTDNGATWKNASAGLPPKVTIGLGGIAASATLLGVVTKENGVFLFDFKKNEWTNVSADPQMLKSNTGAMFFFKNSIYVGTQYGGVFFSDNGGKSWQLKNAGLTDLTIRRFAEIDNQLYAGTNSGLYIYNELAAQWERVYGQNMLQVNGIAELNNNIYIATNQGAFRVEKKAKNWKKVMPNRSLHNISAYDKTVYAMTYNELFASTNNGESWQSIQQGLPKELYTFNVIKNTNAIFAGQWNGVYRKDVPNENWRLSSRGLPAKFAATNLKLFNQILVISTSERKLKSGMATEK